jgi:hypothetical protein
MSVSNKVRNPVARYAQEILSRDLLLGGAFEALIAGDAPTLRRLTEEERRDSLASMLARRTAGDLWVFAYGSLIWNPVIHSVEQRPARAIDFDILSEATIEQQRLAIASSTSNQDGAIDDHEPFSIDHLFRHSPGETSGFA